LARARPRDAGRRQPAKNRGTRVDDQRITPRRPRHPRIARKLVVVAVVDSDPALDRHRHAYRVAHAANALAHQGSFNMSTRRTNHSSPGRWAADVEIDFRVAGGLANTCGTRQLSGRSAQLQAIGCSVASNSSSRPRSAHQRADTSISVYSNACGHTADAGTGSACRSNPSWSTVSFAKTIDALYRLDRRCSGTCRMSDQIVVTNHLPSKSIERTISLSLASFIRRPSPWRLCIDQTTKLGGRADSDCPRLAPYGPSIGFYGNYCLYGQNIPPPTCLAVDSI